MPLENLEEPGCVVDIPDALVVAIEIPLTSTVVVLGVMFTVVVSSAIVNSVVFLVISTLRDITL